MEITKSNGEREEFIREKIVVAATHTGAPLAKAREIAQEVERLAVSGKVKTTGEIRREVLDRLGKLDVKFRQHYETHAKNSAARALK